MSPLDYVVAALALCVVIILHESGHYLTALWSGMKVDRFSVFGIGPAIVKLGTWRGTEFVISAIPFGAYVLIRGMEAEDEPAEAETPADAEPSPNFRDKPLSKRAIVIAGGPIANYITAIALFLFVFVAFGIKQPASAIYIDGFHDDSAPPFAVPSRLVVPAFEDSGSPMTDLERAELTWVLAQRVVAADGRVTPAEELIKERFLIKLLRPCALAEEVMVKMAALSEGQSAYRAEELVAKGGSLHGRTKSSLFKALIQAAKSDRKVTDEELVAILGIATELDAEALGRRQLENVFGSRIDGM